LSGRIVLAFCSAPQLKFHAQQKRRGGEGAVAGLADLEGRVRRIWPWRLVVAVQLISAENQPGGAELSGSGQYNKQNAPVGRGAVISC